MILLFLSDKIRNSMFKLNHKFYSWTKIIKELVTMNDQKWYVVTFIFTWLKSPDLLLVCSKNNNYF